MNHPNYIKITFLTLIATSLITLFFFSRDFFDFLDSIIARDISWALISLKIFLFNWLVVSAPTIFLALIGIRLFYSTNRPAIVFWLIPISIISYNIILIISYIPLVGFSGDMPGLGILIYFIFGNLIYLILTIIGTIFLFFRKKRLKELQIS